MFVVAVASLLALGSVGADASTMWLNEAPNDGRIIMGQNAGMGEFPYMASLRRTSSIPSHMCGGSILTSKWVLSAAHCCASIAKNSSRFCIYAGSIYLSKGGTEHTIERIVMHENYLPADHWKNDICVIKVRNPFALDGKTERITLAPKDWPVRSGDKVTVSGWGLTDPDERFPPDIMQKGVNFVALTNTECTNITRLDMFPGHLCALGGIPGQSTWNGDSGGPLVKEGAQVGLVSFGFRPYAKGNPTVYARVTHYIDWIKEKLGSDASQLKFK